MTYRMQPAVQRYVKARAALLKAAASGDSYRDEEKAAYRTAAAEVAELVVAEAVRAGQIDGGGELAAGGGAGPDPLQTTLPCGCVTCICSSDRCLGCGAKEAPGCAEKRRQGINPHPRPRRGESVDGTARP